jgi:hypothetical protein
VASLRYRFTLVVPRKDRRCIERIIVWDETARALRKEMKNSDSKVRGKKEMAMKMTTLAKGSVFAAALAFICVLAPAARAQADAMPDPDEYPFSAPQTTAAQPMQVASAKATKTDFEGKVSLPYGVQCGAKNLKPGQYSVSVKSEGTSRVVTLRGAGQDMTMRVQEVSAHRVASQNALLVRKSSDGRKLEAVYVQELNATLYFNAASSDGPARMERLPIS